MTPAAAIARLPAGRWAVGVSGGADSVALTRLLAARGDCHLVLAHLNHGLRGGESDRDAAFVQTLGNGLGLPVETAQLLPLPLREGGGGVSRVRQPTGGRNPSPHPLPQGEGWKNPSARYRAARLAWFADVVARHDLDGVVLAHHADDQAETVLLQLARGRGLAFLGGMNERQTLRVDPGAAMTFPDAAAGAADSADVQRFSTLEESAAPAAASRTAPRAHVPLIVHRPLLHADRAALRDYLHALAQPWREDSSNASAAYRRNVLRQWLAERPALTPVLLRLADASRRWRARLDATAPQLPEAFATEALRVPIPYAEHAARRWLVARGAPPDRVSPAVCRRLIAQATHAAAPPRQHYPGGLLVRRRAKRVDVVPAPPVQSPHDGQETARPQDL